MRLARGCGTRKPEPAMVVKRGKLGRLCMHELQKVGWYAIAVIAGLSKHWWRWQMSHARWRRDPHVLHLAIHIFQLRVVDAEHALQVCHDAGGITRQSSREDALLVHTGQGMSERQEVALGTDHHHVNAGCLDRLATNQQLRDVL